MTTCEPAALPVSSLPQSTPLVPAQITLRAVVVSYVKGDGFRHWMAFDFFCYETSSTGFCVRFGT
jgi:hypothetical protein